MVTDYRDTPPLLSRGPFLVHELVIPSTLLVVALCIPHQRWLTTSIFLPAILAAHYRLMQATSNSPATGYAIGTYVVMHTYTSFNLLMFSNPQRDFRRLTPVYKPTADSTTNGEKEKASKGSLEVEGYPQDSLLQRLGWVFELTQAARGIGWNWQIRPIPSLDLRELTSVKTFFRRRLVRLLMIWLWLDFLCFYMRDLDTDYFLPENNAVSSPDTFVPPYQTLFSLRPMKQPPPPKGFPAIPQVDDAWLIRGAYMLFLRTIRTVFSGSAMYATINGQYTIVAVLAASMGCIFGLGEEGNWRRRWLDWKVWPDLFGGWGEGDWGHGVRGWWGTAWHSIFKNSFIAPGRYVISNLGLQKNGPAATVINLTVPFIMSGGLHYGGTYSQSGGGLGCILFFLLQPLGIAIERTLLYFYCHFAPPGMRSKMLEKIVPYAWTFIWFVAVSQSFFHEYRYGGVWNVEPVPLSLIRGLRGDRWWYWSLDADGNGWWKWHESLGGWGIQL